MSSRGRDYHKELFIFIIGSESVHLYSLAKLFAIFLLAKLLITLSKLSWSASSLSIKKVCKPYCSLLIESSFLWAWTLRKVLTVGNTRLRTMYSKIAALGAEYGMKSYKVQMVKIDFVVSSNFHKILQFLSFGKELLFFFLYLLQLHQFDNHNYHQADLKV